MVTLAQLMNIQNFELYIKNYEFSNIIRRTLECAINIPTMSQ